MHAITDHGTLTVTPNGNGYDVKCPLCGFNNRVSSARPYQDKEHRIDVDKISMKCQSTDEEGNSNCSFTVTDVQLQGDY